MNDKDEIGTTLSVEIQKKELPKITIIVSLIISILLSLGGFFFFLIVLAYWLLFLLFQVYRFSRKIVYEFGTKGCIQYYRKGRNLTETIVLYKDIDEPKFNIIDYIVNGNHTWYVFTIHYGKICYTYCYDDDNIPTKDFDYICAHKFYQCWSRYTVGKELDYNESNRITMGILNDMIKK